VGVEGIIVQFIVDPEEYQDEACHPDRKACDINKGIPFVSQDVPESGFYIVSKHRYSLSFLF